MALEFIVALPRIIYIFLPQHPHHCACDQNYHTVIELSYCPTLIWDHLLWKLGMIFLPNHLPAPMTKAIRDWSQLKITQFCPIRPCNPITMHVQP